MPKYTVSRSYLSNANARHPCDLPPTPRLIYSSFPSKSDSLFTLLPQRSAENEIEPTITAGLRVSSCGPVEDLGKMAREDTGGVWSLLEDAAKVTASCLVLFRRVVRHCGCDSQLPRSHGSLSPVDFLLVMTKLTTQTSWPGETSLL